MSGPTVSLALEVDASALPVSEDALRDGVLSILGAAEFPGALSLAVVDDQLMRRLNRDHHATDAATDVLAFPLRDFDDPTPRREGEFDAEVVVSVTTAVREAGERGLDAASELFLYVTHGVLHLMGYDDHEPDDAREMHERTLEILGALGFESRIDGIGPTPTQRGSR